MSQVCLISCDTSLAPRISGIILQVNAVVVFPRFLLIALILAHTFSLSLLSNLAVHAAFGCDLHHAEIVFLSRPREMGWHFWELVPHVLLMVHNKLTSTN